MKLQPCFCMYFIREEYISMPQPQHCRVKLIWRQVSAWRQSAAAFPLALGEINATSGNMMKAACDTPRGDKIFSVFVKYVWPVHDATAVTLLPVDPTGFSD